MSELPIPPSFKQFGEPPPIIEPELLDLPGFDGLDVEEITSVYVEPLDDPEWDNLERQAREVVFADDRVRQLTENHRYAVIGTSRLDSKRARAAAGLLVVYSYDDGLTYEIALTQDQGVVAVGDISSSTSQPAPSDEEIEKAISLATGHRLVADRLEPGFDAHALLTSVVDPGDEHYGGRRFSVVFGLPSERLPRVHAVVDLGSSELIWVHTNEGAQR